MCTSRAVGTASTTPFATYLADPAQARKALADNGAKLSGLQMVIDTTAGANMRTLAQLSKANEANDASLLRRGVLLDVHGVAIRESAQINTRTAGTGASYVTAGGIKPVGATDIQVGTGSGTVLAGDVVKFAGDPRPYVVDVGISAPGVLKIAAPGLAQAAANGTAMTVVATSARNMALAASLPAGRPARRSASRRWPS